MRKERFMSDNKNMRESFDEAAIADEGKATEQKPEAASIDETQNAQSDNEAPCEPTDKTEEETNEESESAERDDSESAAESDEGADEESDTEGEEASPAIESDASEGDATESDTEIDEASVSLAPIEDAPVETVFVSEEEASTAPEQNGDDEGATEEEAIPDEESTPEEAKAPEAPSPAASEEGEDDGEATESAADESASSKESGKRALGYLFEFVELIVITLAAVVLFTTFIMRHSVVEGSSMEGTLYENEHLMISDLFYTPERGDIIVCEDYSTTLRKPLVKRVIALPGERIQIMGDKVLINGVELKEDYVFIDGELEEYNIDIVVPEGELFIMGDHRNNSTDSRDFGPIKEESVIGKVLFRFYPVNTFEIFKDYEYSLEEG